MSRDKASLLGANAQHLMEMDARVVRHYSSEGGVNGFWIGDHHVCRALIAEGKMPVCRCVFSPDMWDKKTDHIQRATFFLVMWTLWGGSTGLGNQKLLPHVMEEENGKIRIKFQHANGQEYDAVKEHDERVIFGQMAFWTSVFAILEEQRVNHRLWEAHETASLEQQQAMHSMSAQGLKEIADQTEALDVSNRAWWFSTLHVRNGEKRGYQTDGSLIKITPGFLSNGAWDIVHTVCPLVLMRRVFADMRVEYHLQLEAAIAAQKSESEIQAIKQQISPLCERIMEDSVRREFLASVRQLMLSETFALYMRGKHGPAMDTVVGWVNYPQYKPGQTDFQTYGEEFNFCQIPKPFWLHETLKLDPPGFVNGEDCGQPQDTATLTEQSGECGWTDTVDRHVSFADTVVHQED